MLKKKKKCYVSCHRINKNEIKRALATRYSLMFTEELEEAEIFFAPRDTDGLSERQIRDLERAESLGIKNRVIEQSSNVLNKDIDDPLGLKARYKDNEVIKTKRMEESIELEL